MHDASDIAAMILHGEKGEISFNSEITSDSTDFFDISAGRTVSEPSIATATTIIVAIPNER